MEQLNEYQEVRDFLLRSFNLTKKQLEIIRNIIKSPELRNVEVIEADFTSPDLYKPGKIEIDLLGYVSPEVYSINGTEDLLARTDLLPYIKEGPEKRDFYIREQFEHIWTLLDASTSDKNRNYVGLILRPL